MCVLAAQCNPFRLVWKDPPADGGVEEEEEKRDCPTVCGEPVTTLN